jgi:hypothetical protein
MSTRTAPSEKSSKVKKEKPLTIFHSIDDSPLPPHEKVARRLTEEGTTIILAGGETVAHTLTHLFFHLLDNPEIYAEVKNEIDEATPAGELIPSLRTLQRLPLLVSILAGHIPASRDPP